MLVLACGALQACSEDEPQQEPEPAASSPTDSPFSATLEGPDVASPGDRLTATITNTGRLPDKYRFAADPEGGATVTPLEVGLSPGESTEVTIDVAASPVLIRVESIGGGSGVTAAQLSIGTQD